MAGLTDFFGGTTGQLIGTGLGLGVDAVKYLFGAGQRKAARDNKLVNPGYELNRDVIDNARIQGEEYNNYKLPGYQQALDNINNSQTTSFTNAERGSTSSADVLDAANKGNQVQQNSLENLAATNAEGKKSALTAYLAAKAAAGEEQQNKNTYDREQYNQQLQLNNQRENNGVANQFSAADQAGKLIASLFSSKGGVKQPGPVSAITQGLSIFGQNGDE